MGRRERLDLRRGHRVYSTTSYIPFTTGGP